jgi:hypothetical protein
MKRFVNAILSVLVLSCLWSVVADEPIQSIYQQSYRVSSFKADTVRYGSPIIVADFENLMIVLKANDTSSAGYASDSIKFVVDWQRGYVTTNSIGNKDTAWQTPLLLIDTFHVASANFYAVAASVYPDSDVVKSLDSLKVYGYVVMARTFCPQISMIGRPVFIGLAGNDKTRFLDFTYDIIQRKYVRVDIGTTKQQEP